MKRLDFAIGLAASLACAGALADGVATTAQLAVFDLDTRVGFPIVSRSEPVALPYGAEATVTVTAPGGVVTTLPAAVNGTNYWTATAGGIWTLENSKEGTATFAVRYTGAEQGAGTEASPWKIVDNDELAGLAISDGFTFVLEGPLASFSEMERPAGYAVAIGEGEAYRLVVSADGAAFVAADVPLALDTRQPGPDRTVSGKTQIFPFAYTGDDWAGDAAAPSTLTFLSPGGVETAVVCTGTGAVEHPLSGAGVWTVTLSGTGVTTLTAHIDYIGEATVMYWR